MQLGERFEAACAVLGQRETNGAPVVKVASALDEARSFRAIDEPDRAVVLEQKVAGDLADRRAALTWVASDRQEELVLGGGEVLGAGLLLAPVEESAQTGSELEQSQVIGIGGLAAHIVAR